MSAPEDFARRMEDYEAFVVTFYGFDENDVLGAELWAVSQARPLAQVQAAENLRRALDRAFEELGQRGITDAWENAFAKAGYGCRNVTGLGESAIREAAAAEEAAAEERYMQTRDYHYERKEPTT